MRSFKSYGLVLVILFAALATALGAVYVAIDSGITYHSTPR
jgi:hypothetical protein